MPFNLVPRKPFERDYDLALIPCSKRKLQSVPASGYVRAVDYYQGIFFKRTLELAHYYAPRVLIMSAHYGLIQLIDEIRPYELKMNRQRAEAMRAHNLAPLAEQKVLSFLPVVYNYAITCDGLESYFPEQIRMGPQCKLARERLKEKQEKYGPVEINLEGKPKRHRQDILQGIEYKTPASNPQGICKFVGDCFEGDELLTAADVNAILVEKFGPAPGMDYAPTIRSQLNQQARLRGYEIERKLLSNQSGQCAYRYVKPKKAKL